MSTAHVYKRDHINTDEIIPARYLNTDDTKELALHCMEDLDMGFLKKCKPGDCIVAGDDFGCGSSREHAVWALQGQKSARLSQRISLGFFIATVLTAAFIRLSLQPPPKQSATVTK
jgi:3-isopropylmalate/(R)-2-methylmalate dehydratase small subunit